MTIKYISFDEKEFDTKAECLAYEKQLKKLLLSVKFYKGRTRMKYTTDEEFYYCYNEATRCIFPSLEVKREVCGYYGFCAIKKDGWSADMNNECLKYRANAKESSWQEDEEV
jgi:hypothetical protein